LDGDDAPSRLKRSKHATSFTGRRDRPARWAAQARGGLGDPDGIPLHRQPRWAPRRPWRR